MKVNNCNRVSSYLPGTKGSVMKKESLSHGQVVQKERNQYQKINSLFKRFAHFLHKVMVLWREEGLNATFQKVGNKLGNVIVTCLGVGAMNNQVFPEVSIVIPVFNALPLTQGCLASLVRGTEYINYEIIIIDNASTDGTSKWLKSQQIEQPNLKFIQMNHNIGFGPAVNIGLRHSKGEYIVILNNDTLVGPGWLNNLLAIIKRDPTIGILSPVTNYVGEGPQIDKQAQSLPPEQEEIDQFAKSIAGRAEVIFEPKRLVFFCVLLRRGLVDLIGGLDEGYEKGNFEDDDYCLRARMIGYRLAIARNSFVYHIGSATFKLNSRIHNRYLEKNRGYFYNKAGRIATSHGPTVSSLADQEISVIVRTKDRPQLLRNALTSLMNQTAINFEVVLVNDGGEDISSIVASYKAYFPITHVNHEISKGRSVAINAGLEKVKGKWVAYLDDDDILYPWHFEVLLQEAGNSNAKVVYSDYNRAVFMNSKALFPSRLKGAPPWEFDRQEILVQNYLPIHSYIHHRDCVEKVGRWNESYDRFEDYEFLIRLSTLYNFHHAKQVTCEYRYYFGTENSNSMGREGYLSALKQIYIDHPVTDSRLLEKRQLVFESSRIQATKMRDLLRIAGNSQEAQLKVFKEIIFLSTGMK
jgi:GT2 family glycosyltransferase